MLNNLNRPFQSGDFVKAGYLNYPFSFKRTTPTIEMLHLISAVLQPR
jgi:hypothetical protein